MINSWRLPTQYRLCCWMYRRFIRDIWVSFSIFPKNKTDVMWANISSNKRQGEHWDLFLNLVKGYAKGCVFHLLFLFCRFNWTWDAILIKLVIAIWPSASATSSDDTKMWQNSTVMMYFRAAEMPWSTNHVLQIVENMFVWYRPQQIMFFSESCDAELISNCESSSVKIKATWFFFFYLYRGGGWSYRSTLKHSKLCHTLCSINKWISDQTNQQHNHHGETSVVSIFFSSLLFLREICAQRKRPCL